MCAFGGGQTIYVVGLNLSLIISTLFPRSLDTGLEAVQRFEPSNSPIFHALLCNFEQLPV